MNGPSGFREVRSSAPRSSTNRLLDEQRPQFGKVSGAVPVSQNLSLVILVLGTLLLWLPCSWATDPITPSGLLHTDVGPPILIGPNTQYDITGGTRPGGVSGTNLFHSFGDFSVPTNNIANFLNTGSVDLNGNVFDFSLPTSNILGTVTGVNPSIIFGMIQTNGPGGFGNANLFLMNPHGFLFGPNATVNVGGMMTFTTADYLRFQGADTLFNKVSTPESLSLLSTVPVAAFGFLGLNPAAIAVQGSQLTVASGTGLSLVGGNQGFTAIDPDTGNPISVPGGVTMAGGTLSAPGGQINLASVASPGEVSAGDFMPTSGMTMGNVSLSQAALLDVSADVAGTVRIRGGQFVIADATISADNGAPVAVDINITGNLSITDSRGVLAITARTTGTGDAGEVRISSGNFSASTTVPDVVFHTLIDTHSAGTGAGGSINISTGDLDITGPAGTFSFIDSGPQAGGRGGDVTINAQTIEMTGALISTGTNTADILNAQGVLPELPTGSAGNLTINANAFFGNTAHFSTAGDSSFGSNQHAGDITLNVHNFHFTNNSSADLTGDFGGGVTITADRFIMDGSALQAFTVSGPGNPIIFNGRVLELNNSSTWTTSTFGDGTAGDIRVSASNHVSLIGKTGPDAFVNSNPTGIFSNSQGFFGSGAAGNIVITTPRLTMDQGKINTTTLSSGGGGDVTINANVVEMLGDFPGEFTGDFFFFNVGNVHPSGILTQTIGSDFCAGLCGNAGSINITTESLIMGAGSQINSGTTNNGQGGNISINATNTISISGTLSDGSPVGVFSRSVGTTPDSGAGGNISLTAGQSVTISDHASVSASSTGAGDAGNVTIQGLASPAESVLIDGSGSGLFTDTQGTGAGGNIFVNANSVTLQNGGTLSAATSGTVPEAIGGTITIAATDVQLSNGALVTAQTTSAGNAGNILVQADSVSITGGAQITSSSVIGDSGEIPTGNAGNITIQGLAGSAESVLISGVSLVGDILQPGGIFTTTSGTGTGGNISIAANTVTIQNGARLDAKSTGTAPEARAGDIAVAADQFTLAQGAQINSSTFGPGSGGNVTIDAGQVQLIGSGTTIKTESNGAGHAGNVSMTANQVLADTAEISANTSGTGNAGNISILTNPAPGLVDEVHLTNGAKISSTTQGTGLGGDIHVKTSNLTLENASITSATVFPLDSIGGNAGNILAEVDTLTMTGGIISTQSLFSSGRAGNVTINATKSASISGSGDTQGAIFTSTQGGPGDAGDITLTVGALNLTNGAQVFAGSQSSSGNGGSVTVTAGDSVLISGSGEFQGTAQASGIIASSTFFSTGHAGQVTVTAPSVVVENGGVISTSTDGAGNAGNITVKADTVSLTGGGHLTSSSVLPFGPDFPEFVPTGSAGTVSVQDQHSPANSVLIDGPRSGIFTDTQGTGAGGSIFVNANTVTLQNGGTLSAATSGTVPEAIGGTITIAATDVQLSNGALVTAQTTSAGNAGNILVQADSVSITGGAQITSSSVIGDSGEIPTGNAGTVTIQGLASPAQLVLITGFFDENFNPPIGGISTETQGTGAGGTINISANEVHLSDGATLSAKTSGSGKAGDIAIQASQVTVDTSLITAETTGLGNAGSISIVTSPSNSTSNSITAAFAGPGDGIQITGSSISTNTTGDGNAGTILLQTTGNLSVSGSDMTSLAVPDMTQGFTGGRAGTIQLLAGQDISLTNSFITVQTGGNKSGGEIVLNGNNLLVEGTDLKSLSLPPEGLTGGDAGDIRVEINGTTRFVGSAVGTTTSGNGNAGNISFTTSQLSLEDSSLSSTTTPTSGRDLNGGSAGNILLKVDQLTVTGDSLISSRSDNSVGRAGNIALIAKESVELLGNGNFPDTITTSSVGAAPSCPGKCGDAGTISITAQTLTLDRVGLTSSTTGDGNAGSLDLAIGTLTVRNGSQLSAGALSTGAGGSISINATGSVDISNPGQVVGHIRPSGLFTNTEGSGPGGNILVNANTVTLQNGGTLSATTSGTEVTATGGTITVDTTNTVTMNSASITASSTGTADAGSINIAAMNGFSMQNSTIATQAGQGAGGGNINVTTAPSATVLLENSRISASVADGSGGGGNISIDPQFVILQNSQILAQAAQGQGGAITIIANLFLSDANSIVNADSGSGVNGTITIQSPNAPISGHIQPLGKTPLIATSLLNQRCASLAGGEFSSFTVAGRDSLPTEPGSWLSSPLAFATRSEGSGLGTKAEGVQAEGERPKDMSASAGQVARGESLFSSSGLFRASNQRNETNQINQMDQIVLSLRKIAPAGFLTQAFAVDEPAGCRS